MMIMMACGGLKSTQRLVVTLLTRTNRSNLMAHLGTNRHLSWSSPSGYQCPFQWLGLEPGVSYDKVKKAFVQLALQHHPDVVLSQDISDDDDDDDTHDTFLRIRHAFESIQNDHGKAVYIPASSRHTHWTDDCLAALLHRETGRHWSFHMDATARRQVATAANTMAPGGLDKGGMWELARSVARQENHRGKWQEDSLTIASGEPASASSTIGRRRRKRK